MENSKLPAILVHGFLQAGKTTYIQDCLKNDYFYKRGKTLLVVCEEGEIEYDMNLLKDRNTELVIYEGGDFTSFLQQKIEQAVPDRLYIEMNAMTEGLYQAAASMLKISFSITLIDGQTLPLYAVNMRQLLQNMVSVSHQVIFNRCELKSLAAFSNLFRVMQPKASYLWESPLGYHEKAFGVMVPFDLSEARLALTEQDFTPFYLDSLAQPDHYQGKHLSLLCKLIPDEYRSDEFKAGRQVMTCCPADIQFLAVACDMNGLPLTENAWVQLEAVGEVRTDQYHQKYLCLRATGITIHPAPQNLVIGL